MKLISVNRNNGEDLSLNEKTNSQHKTASLKLLNVGGRKQCEQQEHSDEDKWFSISTELQEGKVVQNYCKPKKSSSAKRAQLLKVSAPEEGGAAVVFPGTVYNDDQERWEARLRPLISERQQMRAQQGRAAPIHAPYSHRQNPHLLVNWVRGCKSMLVSRGLQDRRTQKEKDLLAMAFRVQTLFRRWRQKVHLQKWLRPALLFWLHKPHFDKWKMWTRMARVMSRVILRMTKLKTWKAFCRWFDVIRFNAAEQFHHAALLKKIWLAWKRYVVTAKSMLFLSNRAVLLSKFKKWRRWLNLWIVWKTAVRSVVQFWVHGNLFEAFYIWKQWSDRSGALAAWRTGCWWPLVQKLILHKYFQPFIQNWQTCLAARIILRGIYMCRLSTALIVLKALPPRAPTPLPSQPQEPTPLPSPPPTPKAPEEPTPTVVSPAEEPEKKTQKRTLIKVKDGRGRQGHCKCVYSVSQNGRCTCDPGSHLMRRIEMLHELTASALTAANSERRVISHVFEVKDPHIGEMHGSSRSSSYQPQRQAAKARKQAISSKTECSKAHDEKGKQAGKTSSTHHTYNAGSKNKHSMTRW